MIAFVLEHSNFRFKSRAEQLKTQKEIKIYAISNNEISKNNPQYTINRILLLQLVPHRGYIDVGDGYWIQFVLEKVTNITSSPATL